MIRLFPTTFSGNLFRVISKVAIVMKDTINLFQESVFGIPRLKINIDTTNGALERVLVTPWKNMVVWGIYVKFQGCISSSKISLELRPWDSRGHSLHKKIPTFWEHLSSHTSYEKSFDSQKKKKNNPFRCLTKNQNPLFQGDFPPRLFFVALKSSSFWKVDSSSLGSEFNVTIIRNWNLPRKIT